MVVHCLLDKITTNYFSFFLIQTVFINCIIEDIQFSRAATNQRVNKEVRGEKCTKVDVMEATI